MPRGDGWYLIGPVIAFALIGLLGTIFWRLGPQQEADCERDPLGDPCPDGLAIFGDPDEYGLLCPAALTEDPRVTEEICRLLCDAGIRATSAMRRDGRFLILVFGEDVEQARRLVGDRPAL